MCSLISLASSVRKHILYTLGCHNITGGLQCSSPAAITPGQFESIEVIQNNAFHLMMGAPM